MLKRRLVDFSLLLFTLLYQKVICQLAITEIIVPTYVKFGTTAVLLCQYDLDGDSLYSVKWYKGSHEFFRHVPNDVPSFRIFPWANFTVEYDIKQPGKVHLMAVTREAEGRYKCEVSTEGPHFNTDYAEKFLSIYDVDSEGPIVMEDEQNELKIGNQLRFTCSFNRSKPKPQIIWFVDGKEVTSRVETRFVMDGNSSRNEWWSLLSEVIVLPTSKQLDRKWLHIGCRVIVVNETIYQRSATLNVTKDSAALYYREIYSKNKIVDPLSISGQQHKVSASMASSQHSTNSIPLQASNRGHQGGTGRSPMTRTASRLLELWPFVAIGMSAILLH